MWQLLLLAAFSVGTGYLAGCMKHKKREASIHALPKEEAAAAERCPSNTDFNMEMKETANVDRNCQQHQGSSWFNYGVGIGAMFMISTGKSEFGKLSSLLNQTADLVQELKRQIDVRKGYLQISEMQKGGAHRENLVPHNNGSCSVGTSSAKSVITDECVHPLSGMAKLEEEFQTELQRIQVDLLKSNSSSHPANISAPCKSSVQMVEGELCADGSLGYCSSHGNETPIAQLEISHVDTYNYGVSPYELNRHLHDLLQKQQEEKISELEMQLKSMEVKLQTKEKELKQWKDRVRYLAEHSSGTSSGEESST